MGVHGEEGVSGKEWAIVQTISYCVKCILLHKRWVKRHIQNWVLYLLQDPSQLPIQQNVTSDTCICQHSKF